MHFISIYRKEISILLVFKNQYYLFTYIYREKSNVFKNQYYLFEYLLNALVILWWPS